MSDASANLAATDETDSRDSWERALLDRQLAALGRLADMGMALAAAITRSVTEAAPEADADLSHAAMDFARVSRAVRMTFALQSRLIAEFKNARARPAKADGAAEGAQALWRPDIVDHDEVMKRKLRGIVERLGQGASMGREAVERLVREAGERLEDDNFYRDLTERPISEIVALVCKDLGVAPDWDLLAETYWAKQEIDRPPLGSPYAGWKARQAQAQPPPLVPSG